MLGKKLHGTPYLLVRLPADSHLNHEAGCSPLLHIPIHELDNAVWRAETGPPLPHILLGHARKSTGVPRVVLLACRRSRPSWGPRQKGSEKVVEPDGVERRFLGLLVGRRYVGPYREGLVQRIGIVAELLHFRGIAIVCFGYCA